MDFFDVQMYASVKLLCVTFIAAAIYLVYKKKDPIYFLILVGLVSATAYIFLTSGLDLSFWGLQGDEVTIAAMYNTFAHVGLGADFAYHSLPPFYPPGFFWFFGAIGGMMNWNGVIIGKFAAFIFFLFFPLGLYLFQKYLSSGSIVKGEFDNKIFTLLSPLLIMTVLEKDVLLGKPYEVIAAAMVILWCVALYQKLVSGKFGWKDYCLYGLIAGIILMTYYLWLIFGAIALLLMGLVEKFGSRINYFAKLVRVALLSILVSLPFIWPFVMSSWRNGLESWQIFFFTPKGLDLWLPMFQLASINNLIMLFGLATLIYFRNNVIIKQLGYLFGAAFIWWVMGIVSLLIFKIPFQEFRGFYILSPIILVLAAAYGIQALWMYSKIDRNKNLRLTILVLAVLYFTSQSMFGFFIDDYYVKLRRTESRTLAPGLISLISFLKSTDNSDSMITLQTIPKLLAFTPINNLLYFNQDLNNPAAVFSERYKYVQSLASAKSSAELYQIVQACPYGPLERFIFQEKKDGYYLYVTLTKLIEGAETQDIIMDKDLFASDYFDKVYDQDGYVVIMTRAK